MLINWLQIAMVMATAKVEEAPAPAPAPSEPILLPTPSRAAREREFHFPVIEAPVSFPDAPDLPDFSDLNPYFSPLSGQPRTSHKPRVPPRGRAGCTRCNGTGSTTRTADGTRAIPTMRCPKCQKART